MKRWVSILMIAALLCGQIAFTAAEETQADEALPQTLALPVIAQYYNYKMSKTEEEGVFYVDLPEEIGDFFEMPTYAWYFNGEEEDVINSVVIEFDILGTVEPLDSKYYGCQKAYYITLHNFETIPVMPVYPSDMYRCMRDDTGQRSMLKMPQIGIDLQKYAVQNGEHVKITIPYSAFRNASKDVTLQFLPGTTYGNLSVYLYGESGLNESILDTILQKAEPQQRDLRGKAILMALQARRESHILPYHLANGTELGNAMHNAPIREGLIINEDGSVNMPTALYDLGDYGSEVQGKYAVIPEGLVPALAIVTNEELFDREDRQQMVNFIFGTMMNDNQQFCGIYDLEQKKMVAVDRKAATLPILSALLMCRDVIKNRDIDKIVNSIIENEIIRIGNTLYYAPNGVDQSGEMMLYLSDFVINSAFFNLMSEYSFDKERLKERNGAAILLEGIVNSLKLILEGQEQNETRLPSASLRVAFSSDGQSYTLHPSDTFDINNSYFSMALLDCEGFSSYMEFRFNRNRNVFDSALQKLSGARAGNLTNNQAQILRNLEAMASEQFNAFTIVNTLYESWLDVYNFLKVQSGNRIYAPAYNVHTGETTWRWGATLEERFKFASGMVRRFGTPATSINYYLLAGIFNDETIVKESEFLALVNYDLFTTRIYRSPGLDIADPDIYADNGFNLWGYDSLQFIHTNLPAHCETYNHYTTSGTTLARETWLEFVMRRLNEGIKNAEHRVSIGDEFPLFYNHLPQMVFGN